MITVNWQWYGFSELSLDQLYEILALREAVFTREQNCQAIDIDGLDKKAVHLLGLKDREIVAYARIFPPEFENSDAVCFGRLLVVKSLRGRELGKQMLAEILKYIHKRYPNIEIDISAQLYLQEFYQDFGFKAYGEVYDEGGISHIGMKRTA